MKRFYTWLRLQFLPEWARRQLIEENENWVRKLADAKQEIAKLESYIDGMRDVLRRQRIVINNQVQGDDES